MDYAEAKEHALALVKCRTGWPCAGEGGSGGGNEPPYCSNGDKLSISDSIFVGHNKPGTHTFSIAALRAELSSPQTEFFA